jgi:AraC-like DNA-binding protein
MIVVALIATSEVRVALGEALQEARRVVWCSHRDEVLPALRDGWVDALLVEPRDREGTSVVPTVLAVREAFPSVPVVACCPLSAAAMHDVLLLSKAGVDDVLVRGIDDVASTVRRIVAGAGARRAASDLLPALRPLLPDDVVPIVACCLEHAAHAITVGQVAALLGVHRKTLVNRLALAGFPTPSAMIAWCRLLLAARLLEDRGRSVEHVALALEFGSGAALRNMLRRYTGLRPGELRQGDGHVEVLRRLQRQLQRRMSRGAGPVPLAS